MNKKTIIGIIAILFVIIFSIQNLHPVPLNFMVWEFNGSLSLYLFLSVLLGIIIGSQFTFILRKNLKDKEKLKTEDKEPLVEK